MKVPRVQTHVSAQGLRGAPSIGCYYQVMTQKAGPWTIVGSMFLEDNSPHFSSDSQKSLVHQVNKNVKNIFLSMCDVKVFLTFTSLNLVLL